ncbi:MAG TPA: DUF2269 family protein [Gaiellaceae bacterium]|nr:DUF2269 family protein [Gaiellaceae bacterium]
MSGTQWLLGFHLVGAVMFVAGAVAVGVLHTAAMRRERPSDVAFLLGLARLAVAIVGIGAIAALAFGAALVHRSGFAWSDGWVSAALVLWIASMVLGGIGGRSARHTRYLAERLAGAGDEPSDELRRALGDPVAQTINLASFLAVLSILGLMVWKP